MERLDHDITFKQTNNRKYYFIIGVVALVVGFVVGILIGVYAVERDHGEGKTPKGETNGHATPDSAKGAFLEGVPIKIIKDGDPRITDKIISMTSPEKIRANLRNLATKPHLAGTPADRGQAQQLFDLWTELGLDEVQLTPYDILLSYPNDSDPNVVKLISPAGDVTFVSTIKEQILSDKENKSDVVLPFNAYSPKGDIMEDLIYVNYARVEDFAKLSELGINVTGKLVIARYGKIFRGDKVNLAERNGAAGVILYSDPADYTWGDNPRVYPDDWWLPGTGVQRGSILLGAGDPQTPGYPSIESAYYYPLNGSAMKEALPKIPCHAIGYDDAEVFLRQLGGTQAPPEWQGKLNVTYNIGGLKATNASVHLHVTTYNSRRRTYNTIGIIRGEIEPDRYVILGNHRDAWVFGAIDPSSGTAALMEVVRVFSELVKTGWRPRRSLVFCSWGAEEYGLHGSTEWVEQYIKSLGERAVAYLNVDISVQGNYSFRALATPLLYNMIYEAAKKVPNPNPEEKAAGRDSVYDTYLHSFPDIDKNGVPVGKPKIWNIGSGSDFAPFLQRIGIPCMDGSYMYDAFRMRLGSYPLYHSAYETFYAVDKLIDRGFHYHTAIANFWAESARHLADSLILPFNVSDYGVALENFRNILYDKYGELMGNGGIDLDHLTTSIKSFQKAAADFNARLKKIDKNNPLVTRMVNDQMIQLERAFTDPAGLPGRPLVRHVVMAPSSVNSYAGVSFSGIADALFQIDSAPDEAARWEVVKHHYTVVVFTVLSAASTLQDVIKFMEVAS